MSFQGCGAEYVDPTTHQCESFVVSGNEYKPDSAKKLVITKAGARLIEPYFLEAEDFPGGPANSYQPTFPQGTITTIAKFAGKTLFSAFRYNGHVYLAADTRRWSVKHHTFLDSCHTKVQFQQRTSTGGWRTIATRNTGSFCPGVGQPAGDGQVKLTIRRAQRRTYRAVTPEVTTAWSSVSGTRAA